MVMQACLNPQKYGANGTSEDRITADGEKAGDVDGNAGLTANDALLIQRYSLKLIDIL
jgi:endoglucanase